MINHKEHWSKQEKSGHRFDSSDFYIKKSIEHAHFLEKDSQKEIVDLGCGAGELLSFVKDYANIKEAIDYSNKMLIIAQKKLKNTDIIFSNVDTFFYLRKCKIPVWMACESLNQYLNKQEHRNILDIFISNECAESIYWFDTICPSRYFLKNKANILNFHESEKTSYLKAIYGFSKGLINSIFKPSALEFNSLGSMGYAIAPSFFIFEKGSEN